MVVVDVVVLVKYAQGLIPFSSYYEHVFALSAEKRSKLLMDFSEMLLSLGVDSGDWKEYLRENLVKPGEDLEIRHDSPIGAVVNDLVSGVEANRTKYLHALLSLFSIAYLKKYSKHKGDPSKFWYWNFDDNSNIEKLRARVMEPVYLSTFP
jgi:hypothetical protein